MPRDTFCSTCGVRFADPTTYPRMCTACGAQTWANPVPGLGSSGFIVR